MKTAIAKVNRVRIVRRAARLATQVSDRDLYQLRSHQASRIESTIRIRAARQAGARPPITPIATPASRPAPIAERLGRYEKNIVPTLSKRLFNPVAEATSSARNSPTMPAATPMITLSA